MRWQLIDKITDYVPGQFIIGKKCFSRTDEFFQDHFPNFPIVPGVLQIEMIAMTCGKALRIEHPDYLPVLGSVKNAKFYSHIYPGDQCFIHGKILKFKKSYAIAEGKVEVDSKKVAQATVLYGLLPQKKDLNICIKDPVIEEWFNATHKQRTNE